MPSEDQQRELNQPWKEWHSELNPDSLSSEALQKGGNGGGGGAPVTPMNHGTVAIQPRPEVSLKEDKPKPET
ncbi:unnamed protein product [Alternaria alternata]